VRDKEKIKIRYYYHDLCLYKTGFCYLFYLKFKFRIGGKTSGDNQDNEQVLKYFKLLFDN
jgi:hypothetical protein